MGLPFRLSEDTCNFSSPSNHQIYVAFCSKNASTPASTFIDCYNPDTNSWHRATSIPLIPDNLVLKDFAMVALSHYIYIIGGRLFPDAIEDSFDENQERVIPCVQRYNVRTDTWGKCAPMSTPRTKFACTINDNKIYVAGGQCTSVRAVGTSSTEVYDPTLNQWRPMANMNMMRFNCVGITWKGRIYVVGGFIDGRPFLDATTRSSAEMYDEKCDRWDCVPRIWDLDIPPNQIVTVNQKLFSSGDCLRPWKGYIESYEENEKIWTAVHDSHFDFTRRATMRRLFLSMASFGNQLYILTGYKIAGEDSRLRSEVHVFDTTGNGEGWRSMQPIEEDAQKELCTQCCVLEYES